MGDTVVRDNNIEIYTGTFQYFYLVFNVKLMLHSCFVIIKLFVVLNIINLWYIIQTSLIKCKTYVTLFIRRDWQYKTIKTLENMNLPNVERNVLNIVFQHTCLLASSSESYYVKYFLAIMCIFSSQYVCLYIVSSIVF